MSLTFDDFWQEPENHYMKVHGGYLSEPFKELIWQMLSLNPKFRPTVERANKFQWMRERVFPIVIKAYIFGKLIE